MSRPIEEIEAELNYIDCTEELDVKNCGRLVRALRQELDQAREEAGE